MSIRPIDFNGMMQRSQDVSTLKQNQDNQPIVQQQHLNQVEEKKVYKQTHQVNEANENDEELAHFDAREEGKNKYFASKKKGKKKEEGDKVTLKKPQSSGFDIKI